MVATSSHTPFGLKKSYRATSGSAPGPGSRRSRKRNSKRPRRGRNTDEIAPRRRASDRHATCLRERSPRLPGFSPMRSGIRRVGLLPENRRALRKTWHARSSAPLTGIGRSRKDEDGARISRSALLRLQEGSCGSGDPRSVGASVFSTGRATAGVPGLTFLRRHSAE